MQVVTPAKSIFAYSHNRIKYNKLVKMVFCECIGTYLHK